MSKISNPLEKVGRLIVQFPGEWVTLSTDKQEIVGHSRKMEAALRQAHQKGVKYPFLIKSPDADTAALIF